MGPETRQIYPVERDPPKPSLSQFTEKQQNTIFAKLYDAMEFFGYLRADNLGDADPGHAGKYGYFSAPALLKELRQKYKPILQNPIGGKDPLKCGQFLASNEDTIRRNAKYKAKYRSDKELHTEAGKLKIKRPVFKGEVVIKDPVKV